MVEGEQYDNEDEWNNRIERGPQLHCSSPCVPLADIMPIHQIPSPTTDSTDYKELVMVLYCQVSDQAEEIAALEADKENWVPSPDCPQPSVHPGTGWQDNFDATGTCHLLSFHLGMKTSLLPSFAMISTTHSPNSLLRMVETVWSIRAHFTLFPKHLVLPLYHLAISYSSTQT